MNPENILKEFKEYFVTYCLGLGIHDNKDPKNIEMVWYVTLECLHLILMINQKWVSYILSQFNFITIAIVVLIIIYIMLFLVYRLGYKCVYSVEVSAK